MLTERTNQQIKLKDGRSLGCAEYGALDGKPVLYFHGFPGSRLDWPFSDANDSATQLNAHIITVDRPGMGPLEAPHIKDGTSWTIPGKPSLIWKLLLMMFDMVLRKNPEKFVTRSKAQFPEPDRLLLDKPEVAKMYLEMLREAFRSGISGVYEEAKLYTRPWKFRLQDISVEVHLWHT